VKTSVIVPTWKRHEKVFKCLNSLVAQEVATDQVIFVYRDIDPESLEVAKKFEDKLPMLIIEVTQPGVIHAENAALKEAKNEIVCFLDDDAEAPKHWIKKIKEYFISDTNIIGVGGPDRIVSNTSDQRWEVDKVGQVTWYGKLIGNHHHIVKKVQHVQVLKGVNMSFRRELVPLLDQKLQSDHNKGNGSSWELDICLQMQKKGIMIFDPELEVAHDSNHSHFIKYDNIRNSSRNYVYVMLKNLNIFRKIIFLIYITLVGNQNTFGVIKVLNEILKTMSFKPLKAYFYHLSGYLLGIQAYLL
jgi:GT2 family glycosyltransferase